ncbi:LacI family DNA-binding transcriptional regulator [Tengunoibacter tsumagoiensis]|uniref:LacI family DNA-binding transcriptional regulator n=1 Tax=Tengunoibacter tsumagoiensis TaxID=2014871 RepID=UPI001386775D|nr:LacI family DNA-binding transcriptional regulator [Tengunoibacter tsumagoiensis]
MEDYSHKRFTIAQIAAAAGVSIATVSKVINQRSDVSAATRARVERVIAERGYVTNRISVSLKKERMGLVNLVVPSLHAPSCLEILRGVEEMLPQAHLRLTLTCAHTAENDERQWLNSVIDGSVEGVVLVLAEETERYWHQLRTQGLPFVIIDRPGELGPNSPSVSTTHWAGGRAAVQYLHSLGHRHIGFILDSQAMSCTRDRLAGYRAALEEARIPFNADLIHYGSTTLNAGYVETGKLLDQDHPPTALLTETDEQALGAYRALHERGIRIPEEVSVISFEETILAHTITPSLTTIRQPLYEMGRTAVTMLQNLLEGKALNGTRVELATPLIERNSCGPRRRSHSLEDSSPDHRHQWQKNQIKGA